MTRAKYAPDPEMLLVHRDFVRAVARSLLWDTHGVEDVVQETWLAALRTQRPPSRGWLYVVTRHIALNRIRSERRRAHHESAAARPEGIVSDSEVLDRERVRRTVVRETLGLHEPYRSTILLRYFEGLTPREVALRIGVPVETVRTRTRRACEILRTRLDERHRGRRDSLCLALAAWSGPRTGDAASWIGRLGTAGGYLMAKKVIAVAVALVAVGLIVRAFWPTPAAHTPVEASRSESATPSPRTRAVPRETQTAPSPLESPAVAPSAKSAVGGRVIDTQGRPATAAEVQLLAGEPRMVAGNLVTGDLHRITTDTEGRFEQPFPTGTKCKVQLSLDPRFEGKPNDIREVVAPTEGIEFVVEPRPTAKLIVTVFDVDAGAPLTSYRCSFGSRVVRQEPTSPDGKTNVLVRLASPAGETVKFDVTGDGATATRDVALQQGAAVEVRVELRCGTPLVGHVVDATGRPLAGAFVFFGDEVRARGDEPFKPFNEALLTSQAEGTRTGPDGEFVLKGRGRLVTAWHPDASPSTVPADRAADLVLLARGTVRGVVRDAHGNPAPGQKVYLDRVRETTSDAGGRFEFDRVEAGTRGLSLVAGKPKKYVAVRVAAGGVTEVDLRPGVPLVRIEWPGRSTFEGDAVLTALGDVGTVVALKSSEGALFAADVLPGRYVLILQNGQGTALVDVSGPTATAIVGTGSILVRAKPSTKLYAVPEGADYNTRLMAYRIGSVRADARGVARFSGLAPGRWSIGDEVGCARVTVEVGSEVAVTTLE